MNLLLGFHIKHNGLKARNEQKFTVLWCSFLLVTQLPFFIITFITARCMIAIFCEKGSKTAFVHLKFVFDKGNEYLHGKDMKKSDQCKIPDRFISIFKSVTNLLHHLVELKQCLIKNIAMLLVCIICDWF